MDKRQLKLAMIVARVNSDVGGILATMTIKKLERISDLPSLEAAKLISDINILLINSGKAELGVDYKEVI